MFKGERQLIWVPNLKIVEHIRRKQRNPVLPFELRGWGRERVCIQSNCKMCHLLWCSNLQGTFYSTANSPALPGVFTHPVYKYLSQFFPVWLSVLVSISRTRAALPGNSRGSGSLLAVDGLGLFAWSLLYLATNFPELNTVPMIQTVNWKLTIVFPGASSCISVWASFPRTSSYGNHSMPTLLGLFSFSFFCLLVFNFITISLTIKQAQSWSLPFSLHTIVILSKLFGLFRPLRMYETIGQGILKFLLCLPSSNIFPGQYCTKEHLCP